jgi:hypothetical protein
MALTRITTLFTALALPIILAVSPMSHADTQTSASTLSLIDQFKLKHEPLGSVDGVYAGTIQEGVMLYAITYTFDQGTLTKQYDATGQLGSIQLMGSANYQFDGSTLQFSDAKGDPELFEEQGEAVTVGSRSIVLFNEQNGDEPIAILTKKNGDEPSPVLAN